MMSKVMKHVRALLVVAMVPVGLSLVGCKTTGTIGSLPPPVQPTEAPADETGVAELAVQNLNVAVAASGRERAGEQIADRVLRRVTDQLAERKFKLDSSPADLDVNLAVTAEQFDAIGNYRLYKGEVEYEVVKVSDGRKVGGGIIAESGGRELGDAAALNSLGDKLAGQTAEQVADTCTAQAANVRAVNVTVRRAWRLGDDSRYSANFVNTVNGFDGVLHCSLVEQSIADRTMIFRIVYEIDKFPEGMLNRLANTPALNFKPVD